MEEAKTALREAVDWPLRYAPALAHAGARPARGILLTGPPGCSLHRVPGRDRRAGPPPWQRR
jgi:SpoVK/Ycf46/Vps4 family AAA+-type ATPase